MSDAIAAARQQAIRDSPWLRKRIKEARERREQERAAQLEALRAWGERMYDTGWTDCRAWGHLQPSVLDNQNPHRRNPATAEET